MSKTPETAAALKHCTATMPPEDWCAYMAKTCQALETQRDEARAEGEMIVCAILGDEIKDDTPAYILNLSRPAKDWDWSKDSNDLLGWRPADAPEKLPRK